MIACAIDPDGIATLTIDIPGRTMNLFDDALLCALSEGVEAVAADSRIKGAIITSGKPTFLAGADIKIFGDYVGPDIGWERTHQLAGRLPALLRGLETCGKPVVAAVNGTSLGGGLELALACHHRVVADLPTAKLGLPEVTIGILPGAGGTQRLPRIIGIAPALPLLMEGPHLSPQEALALGIADELAPLDQLVARAKVWLHGNAATATAPWDAPGFAPPGPGIDSSAVAEALEKARAHVAARPHYPAPATILRCVVEGMSMSIDDALQYELRSFTDLLRTTVAQNMIRSSFIHLHEVRKGLRRPVVDEVDRPIPHASFTKVAILGAGTWADDIAKAAARAGLRVLTDRDVPAECDALLAPADSTLIGPVRAAASSVPSAAVFLCSDGAPIDEVAGALELHRRTAGLHFPSSSVVEIIRPTVSDRVVLAKAFDFVSLLRRTPVLVADRPGFYVDRVRLNFIAEGLLMVSEGFAPERVDEAARLAGIGMGPLQLAEAIGIQAVRNGIERSSAVTPLNEEEREFVETILAARAEGKQWDAASFDRSHPNDQRRIETRLLYSQVLEALRCFATAVIDSPIDADVASLTGWGFPAYAGGPFSFIDMVGADVALLEADRLANVHGERFRAPSLLSRLAIDGARFYEGLLPPAAHI